MLNTIINLLERLITGIGRVVALFVLAIIAIMIYEMFSRAVLGRSVRWAGDASTWLLVAFIFLGGPWAMGGQRAGHGRPVGRPVERPLGGSWSGPWVDLDSVGGQTKAIS